LNGGRGAARENGGFRVAAVYSNARERMEGWERVGMARGWGMGMCQYGHVESSELIVDICLVCVGKSGSMRKRRRVYCICESTASSLLFEREHYC
jgi:hypothetical protein